MFKKIKAKNNIRKSNAGATSSSALAARPLEEEEEQAKPTIVKKSTVPAGRPSVLSAGSSKKSTYLSMGNNVRVEHAEESTTAAVGATTTTMTTTTTTTTTNTTTQKRHRLVLKQTLPSSLSMEPSLASLDSRSDYSAEALRQLKISSSMAASVRRRVEHDDGEQLVSMMDEDDQTSPTYSSHENTAADIKDRALIEAARQKRILARQLQEVDARQGAIHATARSKNLSDDGENFIRVGPSHSGPMDEDEQDDPLHTRRRRHVKEDDDGSSDGSQDPNDGEELFGEDYTQDRLAFGHEAVRSLKEKRRKDMIQRVFDEDAIGYGGEANIRDDEEEDEEVLEWERQQIKKGAHGHDTKTPDLLQERRRKNRGQLPNIPLPVYAEEWKRFQVSISNMKAQYQQDSANMQILSEEKTNLESLLDRIRGDVQSCSEKFNFFEEFRTWMESFVQWLEAKMPALEKLELDYREFLCGKVARRNQDRLLRLQDSVDCWSSGNVSKRIVVEQSESMMTDEDQDPEEEVFQLALQQLFDDTQEEFRSLPMVLSRLSFWRRNYRDDYFGAFVGLCIPGVVEIFVRRENWLSWNPLRRNVDFTELTEIPWHRAMVGFNNEFADDVKDQDSVEAFSRTIEKFVLPFLRDMIYRPVSTETNGNDGMAIDGTSHKGQSALDVFDSKQVETLVLVVDNLQYYFDDETLISGGLRTLLELVDRRWKDSVKELLEAVDIPHQIDETHHPERTELRISAVEDTLQLAMQLIKNTLTFHQKNDHLYGKIFSLPHWFLQAVDVRRILDEVVLETLRVVTPMLSQVACIRYSEVAVPVMEELSNVVPVQWKPPGEWSLISTMAETLHLDLERESDEESRIWKRRLVALLVKIGAHEKAAIYGSRTE